jgi:hypothetical protein
VSSRVRVLIGSIVTATAALDFLGHPHGQTWWHHVPGFDLVYGAVGCMAIVIVSKALGKVWLQRRERHYETVDE